MSWRSVFLLSGLLMATVFAGTGFAQNTSKLPTPGTHIAVAKCAAATPRNVDCHGNYSTIQAAVNAAQPGQIIEILDEGIYAEQVTIDGRDTSPWSGVTGGKHGITIRYVPSPVAPDLRPTISWRDITNTSPRNAAEARTPGELVGQSGNFETNGALRILSARGVTIEGLIVDGGSAFPFGATGVWCSPAGGACHPLFHGNAAITLAVSGGVVIRNCHLRNAYFGINVKDRNTGGAFGNPNPSDNDVTVPLSGFGNAGNHLFEHNRIHNNSVGIFFESAWDLGSTVRYNLIFNNQHTPAVASAIVIERENQNAGAFLFRDMYLTPVAIYNNTLHNNWSNFLGNWQVGGQHLIFNNIFGLSTPTSNPSPAMTIDDMFTNRTHNNVSTETISPGASLFQSVDPVDANFLHPKWEDPVVVQHIKNKGWAAAGIRNADGRIADLGAIPSPREGQAQSQGYPTNLTRIVPVGVVQINGTTATAEVIINNYNGAIQNPTISFLRWIAPLPENNVFGKDWANNFDIVPATSIRTITPPTVPVSYGRNRFQFTIPAGAAPTYGFFEIVLTGTDAVTGAQVSSDVGFLPYRQLDLYYLDISVHNRSTGPAPTSHTGAATSVRAGDTVWLYVSARNNQTPFAQNLNQITYALLSDPTASMLCVGTGCPAASLMPATQYGRALTEDRGVPGAGKAYEVIFTNAGQEAILATGLYEQGAQRSPFLGICDIIVRPGAPAQVEFKNPVPLLQIGGDTNRAAPIGRGRDETVLVEVQDKFKNPVDVAAQVRISSDNAEVGDAGAPGAIATKTVTSDPTTGIATFAATVTNGIPGQAFTITATLTSNNATDEGAFRVGRVLDRLMVFYSDNGTSRNWSDYYDPSVTINANFGEWVQVTVKAVTPDPDTVITSKNGCVHAVSDPPVLAMSATQGGALAETFPMTNGVTTFWVSNIPGHPTSITNAALEVNMYQPGCEVRDNSIPGGYREGINFTDDVSVQSIDRVVPPHNSGGDDMAIVTPVNALTAKLTAGPNPARKSQGTVSFYRQGKHVDSAVLTVYDAAGSTVGKIRINDNAVLGSDEKRAVGSWNLTDAKGRPVPGGTYLIRGTLSTADGGRERVSIVVGVR